MEITAPEQLWVSDITYIRTDHGFAYLSLITDHYSKKIMGYCLYPTLSTKGPLEALKMALKSRVYKDRELMHHSDRGFQYCSDDYVKILKDNNIKISMTENSDPYENAVAERVNGILKSEFDIDQGFVNNAQAAQSGYIWIIVGFLVLLTAVRQLNKIKTTVHPDGVTTAIVSSGIFKYSRNPIYLSFTLLYLGVVLLSNAIIGLVLLVPLLSITQKGIIEREEKYLLKKFGEEYAHYKSTVRRWI
jgi:protein-S-isoprenylcysteine O-methyltransferase Ste14